MHSAASGCRDLREIAPAGRTGFFSARGSRLLRQSKQEGGSIRRQISRRSWPARPALGEAAEDCLKAIHQSATGGAPVATGALAAVLRVTPAAVTQMLRRLSALRLVDNPRYRGVRLTPAGRRVAAEILRHHRLLELYLSRALGYPLDRVHAEAEVLEHAISEDFEERIDRLLGHPTLDPHGHPIPPREGKSARRARRQ
jgi:DtxR family Mn-dependent transcriptional regulator